MASLYSGYVDEEDGTFENCTSLSNVTIGASVKEIGIDTFANTALKQVAIPDGVTTIGDGAFYKCEFLEEALIGKKVKTIGKKLSIPVNY